MADVFRLLAEPTRRHILEALRDGERSVNDLVDRTRMSQPAVSKQLRILRDSGLVTLRAAGRHHMYSIRGGSLREASEWLSYYERFWQDGLRRMEKALGPGGGSARRSTRRRGP